jgi:hypothetical protein
MEELDVLTLLLLAIHIGEPFLHDDTSLCDCTDNAIILSDPCTPPDSIPMPLGGLDHGRIPIGSPHDGDQIELGQCDALEWGKILIKLARLEVQNHRSKGVSTA